MEKTTLMTVKGPPLHVSGFLDAPSIPQSRRPSLVFAEESGPYDNTTDEHLLHMIVEMIEKNKRKDFAQLTIDLSSNKKRLARLLKMPIKRNFRLNNNKLNKDDDVATNADGTFPAEEEEPWWTALHLMAKNNRAEMINAAADSIEELLIKLGGTDNFPDVFGQTPLHVACIKGHVAVCRMLCRQAVALAAGKAAKYMQGNGPGSVAHLLNAQDILGYTALHYCMLLQNRSQAEELAKILLVNGCDPNIPDTDGYTPLGLCANRGSLELTSLLMAHGANPNVQSPEDGWTPLMLAAYSGHSKLASCLLNPQMLPNMNENLPRNMAPTPASPALQSKLGATALIIASQLGHADIVADMLSISKLTLPTINYQDVTGRTALATATFKGFSQVVGVLLEKRADPNITDNEGVSPLMLAIHKGHRGIADQLIQNGCDVNLRDENGCTALMIAAEHSNVEVTRSLLSSVANFPSKLHDLVDAQQKDGTTALMIAATKGSEKIIELLMNAMAAMEPSRQIDDWTALFHGIYFEKVKIIKTMILKQPTAPGMVSPGSLMNRVLAELNRHANLSKLTPLLLACLMGNTPMVRILLENGSNVNSFDHSNFTPLMASCQIGDEKLVHLLLTKGAKPDAQDYAGYSALMIAALRGYAKIADNLLSQGASADLQQVNGRTAVMLAAEKGHYEVVKVLLRRGCDVSFRDVSERTVLHYAIIGANEKVTTILCEDERLDVNAKDRLGETPLMLAARTPFEKIEPQKHQSSTSSSSSGGGRLMVQQQQQQVQASKSIGGPPQEILHIIPLLKLKGRIDLDLKDNEGDTALMKAYRYENWPFAEAIIRAGASTTIRSALDGYTPLILAAVCGYLQGIKLIKHLSFKTVNVLDAYSRSALFHAVDNEKLEAVRLLLSQPAPLDINHHPSKSKATAKHLHFFPDGKKIWFWGSSPLHVAAKYGNIEIVNILLLFGANLSSVNDKKETPLMCAAAGAHWEIVEIFLANGADISAKDSAGQTVLHRLCYIGDENEATRGFRLFVKHRGYGCLDTVVDSALNTALHWAVVCDQPEVVNELIILGANKEKKNKEGRIPLQMVIYAPTLFESLGSMIGGQWKEFARHLHKSGDKNSSDEPILSEEDLTNIEEYHKTDAENFQENCAAAMVEKYYEKNGDKGDLDSAAIESAWRQVYGLSPDDSLPLVLSNLLDHCKDKTLIFKSATLENLTKFRSKSRDGTNLY